MKHLAAAALLAFFAASPEAAIIGAGHTGVWRNVERSGEGVTLEILGADSASMVWFTYDDDGDPRWAYGVGAIVRDAEGERIEFPDLYRSSGGRFAAAYAPADVTIQRVGTATLRFDDCNTGRFEFEAFGQTLEIDQQRLTRVMAASCGAPIHGLPGDRIFSYAGQSGVWNDPSRFGQGIQLQWTADNAPGIGWYTFDADGNPYWLTGLGQLQGEPSADGSSRIVFPVLYAPRGARFGDAYDPADVELIQWGRAELELSCSGGVLRWESTVPGFGSGERGMRLLTRSVPAACPWVAPKLQDLYDITYTELPMPPPEVINGVLRAYNIQGTSIADDGTVAAVEPLNPSSGLGSRLLRLLPGGLQWEELAASGHNTPALVSPDGSRIYSASTRDAATGERPTLWWRPSLGVSRLPQRIAYESEALFGISQDGSRIVGLGSPPNDVRSWGWKWDATLGQVQLPFSPVNGYGIPLGLSNDGNVVVGTTEKVFSGFIANAAIRWKDGQPAESLYDGDGNELGVARTCNTDCSLILGFGWSLSAPDPARPKSAQPWIWRGPGRTQYLGTPANAAVGRLVSIEDVSHDGSIVVGGYNPRTELLFFQAEGWIWTQNTGLVSLRDLLEELNLSGPWTNRSIVSLSSDGRAMLISGTEVVAGPSQVTNRRAVILRLAPKSAAGDPAIGAARP